MDKVRNLKRYFLEKKKVSQKLSECQKNKTTPFFKTINYFNRNKGIAVYAGKIPKHLQNFKIWTLYNAISFSANIWAKLILQ